MDIIIGCEESQRVCMAFRELGHNAYSCDVMETSGNHPEWHIRGDILEVIGDGWDIGIFFPPCTYLAGSGLHWNRRIPGRTEKTENALKLVQCLLDADIPKISLENPIGIISTRIRKPDQIIQQYDFGENASKKTCLWLKNLPPLIPTEHILPRIVEYKGKMVRRWGNQTDSGQNRLGPSDDRAMIRSKTPIGLARAMADQWGIETAIEKQTALFE